jgi:DeoR/GlpR family transcriptional regulator of sugar metabolism
MPRTPDEARRRQTALTEMLARGERLSTARLADRLGVAPMTIRRDLDALQRDGTAVRTHGGAVTARRITFSFAFETRRQRHLAEKRRIGSEAARRVRAGETVFLDTGTTTLEVARALVARAIPCRVATSSLVVASILWNRPPVELTLLGGRVRQSSPDLVGFGTELLLDRTVADIAFVGSEGLDPVHGSHAEDPEAAHVTERMAANARRVVCVADASKLGHAGPARCLATADLDELITDRRADRGVVAALKARGIKITRV